MAGLTVVHDREKGVLGVGVPTEKCSCGGVWTG